MIRNFTKLFSSLVLLFFAHFVNAQRAEVDVVPLEPGHIIFSAYGGMTLPLSTFAENLPASSIGAGIDMLFLVDADLPLYAGFSLGNYEYGREILISELTIDDIFSVYEQQTFNSIFIGNILFSVRPDLGWGIKPYAEGFFGTVNMNTRTTLADLNVSSEPFDRYLNVGTWSFSIGAALGLEVPFPVLHDKLSLNFKCSYMKGTAVDYLVSAQEEDVFADESIELFEEKNSITDLILPQLGISFTFGPRLIDAFEE